MRKTKERWFHVRGIATYETELFVQAATREEAEEVYLSNDNRDSGKRLEERFLDVEECQSPL